MIGKKFTNNLKSNRSLFDNPLEWAIARNLAYASIRDDIEKIIKQTNENSADTYINAENLLQNLKSKSIHQYIEAERVTQNIDLSDERQLNQIFMNSEVYQKINYVTRNKVIKQFRSHIKSNIGSFLNNEMVVLTGIYKGPKNIEVKCYAFDKVIKMREFLVNFYKERYEKDMPGLVVENSEKLQGTDKQIIRYPKDFKKSGNFSWQNLNYLIFTIDDSDLDNEPFFKTYDDIIMLINLKNTKLQQTKLNEIEGTEFLNTLGSYDKLKLMSGSLFKKTDYGKIESLKQNTKRFYGGNLFK